MVSHQSFLANDGNKAPSTGSGFFDNNFFGISEIDPALDFVSTYERKTWMSREPQFVLNIQYAFDRKTANTRLFCAFQICHFLT